MKVALIHDHLAQDGGAERVLRILAKMYPEAKIYTMLKDKDVADQILKDRQIDTSIIQRLPGGVKYYKWYLPLMPMAVEFFDLRQFDLVISDASAFAKGVITSPETLHICYCHTPTRYLWSDTHQYINELKYNKYFKKIISLILNYIRLWDKAAAERVDFFIANSKTVAKRITKYYRRDSEVIYPPVETERFKIHDEMGDYFLIGGRLVPYKRIDNVVKAFLGSGRKLKIYGNGPDRQRLEEIAVNADNIEFLGRVSDEELAELYGRCQAFINPQVEDFGITMVEAMAAGRPVIALREGGATEIIEAGKNGYFFETDDPGAIRQAIEKFDAKNFNPAEIKQMAEKYSVERFEREIKDFVEKKMNDVKC